MLWLLFLIGFLCIFKQDKHLFSFHRLQQHLLPCPLCYSRGISAHHSPGSPTFHLWSSNSDSALTNGAACLPSSHTCIVRALRTLKSDHQQAAFTTRSNNSMTLHILSSSGLNNMPLGRNTKVTRKVLSSRTRLVMRTEAFRYIIRSLTRKDTLQCLFKILRKLSSFLAKFVAFPNCMSESRVTFIGVANIHWVPTVGRGLGLQRPHKGDKSKRGPDLV